MRERGERTTAIVLALLAAYLFVAIAFPVHGYTLIPDQIHTLPATIRLNYSAPVTIVGAELWNVLSGQREAVFDAGNFTDISGNGKVYRVMIDNVLPGQHDLVVSKNDAAPPFKILQDDPVRFEYQPSDAAFNLHLTSPRPLAPTPPGHPYEEGFAQSAPYRANFTTTKPGWCKYSLNGLSNPLFMIPFEETGEPSAPTTQHAITGLVATTIDPLIVWCNSTDNGAITTAFVLGYEDAPPSFTVTADPATIVDELDPRTLVTVQSDQPVYCEARGDSRQQSFAPDGLGPTDAGAYSYTPSTNLTFADRPDNPIEKDFEIDCVDRAGRVAAKMLTVRINLQYTPAIIMVSPERYTRDRNVVLAVQVVKHGTPVKSGSCVFANGSQLATTDGITYNASFTNLADGTYAYRITCVIAGGVQITGNVAFDVDTTPPPAARTITAPAAVCGDQPFTAQVTLSPDTEEDPGFAGYRFNITYTSGNKVVASGTAPPDGGLVADFEATENTSYVWHVWPYDLSGNVGTELTATSLALPANDSRCDVTPPLIDIFTEDSPLGTSVALNCTDTESGCTETYSYDKLPSNATKEDCAYATIGKYIEPLLFGENGSLCYRASDRNRNNATGFILIGVNGSAIQPSSHCDNAVLDVALGETGVDCGGQCNPCPVGENCTTGGDCISGACDAGVCIAANCSDGKQNQDESDVDCGGVCDPCALGKACNGDQDCTSSHCSSGTCTELVSCTTADDCSPGQICDAGVCTEPAPSGCNPACGEDEECIDGVCEPTSSQGKTPLLAIILIILGLLTMGGSGYWLYTLHAFRVSEQREEMMSGPAYRPQQSELTPEQRAALLRQRQAQLEALRQRRQVAQQRAAEKAAERHRALDAFDEAGAATGTDARASPQGENQPAEADTASAKEAPSDEEFIDLNQLGKKVEAKTVEQAATSAEKKKEEEKEEGKESKDSAFADLDDLIEDAAPDAQQDDGGKSE